MLNDYPDVLSTKEVMEILDIGKNSLYILLNSGKLRAARVGKVWKIPKEAIEEYFVTVDDLSSHINPDRQIE